MDLVLALDAGTTGVRTVAFGPDGAEVDSAYRELTQYFPEPGWVEHDPHEIAELAVATLREVATRIAALQHRVVARGITNQRETTVAFDRATGQTRHRAIVWQDRRTASFCEQLAANGALPRVREITGLVLDSYFSGTKMRWLLDHHATDGFVNPALGGQGIWDYVANKTADFVAMDQIVSQLWDIGITLVWSGFVAFVILLILKHTIGIRASDEDQEEGLDLADHGERAYQH